MDERTLIFQKLQKGEVIFTLEKDRRSTIQKQNALNILNNRPKFEAVVSECDNILNSINQSQSAPSRPAPEFDEFRQYIDQRITTQETLLQRIAQELGLDKPK